MKYLQTLVVYFFIAAYLVLECRAQDRKECAAFTFTLTNGIPHLASIWSSLLSPNESTQNISSLYSNAKMRHTKEARGDGSGYWVIKAEGKKPLRDALDSSFSSLSDKSAIRVLEECVYKYTAGSWLTMEAQYEISANGTNAIVFLAGDKQRSAFTEWNTVTLHSDGSIERNELVSGDLANSWRWFYPKAPIGESANSVKCKNCKLHGLGMFLRRYFVQHVPLCFIQMTVDQNKRLAGSGICLSQTALYGDRIGLEISLNEVANVVDSIKIYDGDRGVVALWNVDPTHIDMLSAQASSSYVRMLASTNKIQGVFAKEYAGRISSKPLCLYKTLAEGRIDTRFSIVPNLEGQPYAYGAQVVFSKDGKKVDKIEVYRDGEVIATWGNSVIGKDVR